MFQRLLLAVIVACIAITHLRGVEALDFRCTACVVVTDILEQQIKDHPDQVKEFFSKICTVVPDRFKDICKLIISTSEPLIIDLLLKQESPSKICNQISYFDCQGCSMEKSLRLNAPENHHLFRKLHWYNYAMLTRKYPRQGFTPMFSSGNSDNLIPATEIFGPLGDSLLPALDSDKDFFSPIHPVLRGADWRGKDCDDKNANVRPGLRQDSDIDRDGNCNGIYGRTQTGSSEGWEQKLCLGQESKSSLYQIISFGDSASSHFEIPPEWFKLENLTKIFSAIDELDWPQKSWGTGYVDDIKGESIYLHLRDINRCNHRAYQNVGHNGHRIHHFAHEQIPALNMDPHKDRPVFGFVSYIGNDVCRGSEPKDITSDEEFRKDMIDGLVKLNTTLPDNSKIIFMGLVDGRILWNEMHNLTHPLGDVTYEEVYKFLTCTKANPCNNFLNVDPKIRNEAAQRAAQLSHVAATVVQEYKDKVNYALDYIPFPLPEALKYCRQQGEPGNSELPPCSELIAKVDGFHPSELAHRLFSKIIWEWLEAKHKDWIGSTNPHNQQIENLFGDQGGY